MARKKDKKVRAAPRTSTGWAAEEAAEEKIAEGLKRSDLDDGKVILFAQCADLSLRNQTFSLKE